MAISRGRRVQLRDLVALWVTEIGPSDPERITKPCALVLMLSFLKSQENFTLSRSGECSVILQTSLHEDSSGHHSIMRASRCDFKLEIAPDCFFLG